MENKDNINGVNINEERNYSVYMHINLQNLKLYVGITGREPKDRWQNGHGYKGNSYLWRAINKAKKRAKDEKLDKDGWNKYFAHLILFRNLTKAEAEAKEVELIAEYRSAERGRGYNIHLGGNSKGNHSEETRKKISEAQKGENNHMYGKHISEETRKKMSEAHKGKHEGENNPMYGKHFSKETRKKMSEAKTGKKHTEETRNKISEAQKGKKHTEETRNKMREAKKGENNPRAKVVYCDGKIFSSATDCAKFYNVNYGTMCSWLQGRRKTPFEFIDKGLRFATEEEINTYPLHIEKQNQQDQ